MFCICGRILYAEGEPMPKRHWKPEDHSLTPTPETKPEAAPQQNWRKKWRNPSPVAAVAVSPAQAAALEAQKPSPEVKPSIGQRVPGS